MMSFLVGVAILVIFGGGVLVLGTVICRNDKSADIEDKLEAGFQAMGIVFYLVAIAWLVGTIATALF